VSGGNLTGDDADVDALLSEYNKAGAQITPSEVPAAAGPPISFQNNNNTINGDNLHSDTQQASAPQSPQRNIETSQENERNNQQTQNDHPPPLPFDPSHLLFLLDREVNECLVEVRQSVANTTRCVCRRGFWRRA
jgi:hypothetical protein